MDMDEDDDLYVPEEPKLAKEEEAKPPRADDLEEGEEEDESGAMDEDSDSDSVSWTAHDFYVCGITG